MSGTESLLCWSCQSDRHRQVTNKSRIPLIYKSKQDSEMEDNVWKTRLATSLCAAWHEKLYTDLTIVTPDETFQVHKVVMAVASPYFRALLGANLSESHTNILRLESVSGETLRATLEYMYSGKVDLNEGKACDVLSLADYFQIHDLKKLCCRYLKNHLAPYSCLHTYEMALLHQCHDLASEAFQMALKNCSEVIREPSFLSLQPSTLAQLFKQQILDISSEDELLKALMAWTAYNKEERCTWYNSLLNLLNEDQLNPLMRGVFHEEVEESEMEAVACEGGSEERVAKRCKTVALRHKKEEQLIIVFGGESSGRILGNAECFKMGQNTWRCSIPFRAEEEKDLNQMEGQQVIPPMKQQRAYAAVAFRDNVVYLIGGQTSNRFLNSSETYHVESNQWGTFPDIPLCLHAAEASFFQGKLWVVGGRTDEGSSIQNSLLMYDQQRENWCFKSPMLKGRVHFGLAALHGSLFAVGGVGAERGVGAEGGSSGDILSSCERYDVEADEWIPIAPLVEGRGYHGVAVVNDFLYAIGGYDGYHWMSSVERYDPLTDRWSTVSPMIGARSSFGVTVSHGRVYCLGGFSGQTLLNTVEKYNPRTDMWHCVQSMRRKRYGLMAATVKLPAEKLTSDKYGYHTNMPNASR